MKGLYSEEEFNLSKSKDKLKCECYTCQGIFLLPKNKIKYIIKHNSNKGKYCSKGCQNISQITQVEVSCSQCGEKIKRTPSQLNENSNSFCSRSCSAIFNNSLRDYNKFKTKKKYNCYQCNEECGYRRKYCDSCKDKLYMKEEETSIADVVYKNHHKAASFAYIRDKAKRKLKKERVEMCEVCSYDKHVECCHIKNISDFELTALLSEVNHINNLLWLCPNHHWEFDFGDLKLEDIKRSLYYHDNI